jgi:endonuclease G
VPSLLHHFCANILPDYRAAEYPTTRFLTLSQPNTTPAPAIGDFALTQPATRVDNGLLRGGGKDWMKGSTAFAIFIVVCAVFSAAVVSNDGGRATKAQPASPGWLLRSRHLLYGVPVPTDSRYDFDADGDGQREVGISVLVREGFVVGHADRLKTPVWVSMRWTAEDLTNSSDGPSHQRRFKVDTELPEYARAGTNFEHSQSLMDRGHLARHRDNAAWGEDNSDAGCLMSNIAPQHMDLNRGTWLALEDAHRTIVGDPASGIAELWVISGTIHAGEGSPQKTVGNGVYVPNAFFKIVAWFDVSGALYLRAYEFPQETTGGDPKQFLTTVDSIEAKVGIDFFPTLEDWYESSVEAELSTQMWPSARETP